MPIRLFLGVLLGLIFCANAATHSAWSDPIAWDAISAVQTPVAARTVVQPGTLLVSPNPASPGQPIFFAASGGRIDKIDVYDAVGKLVISIHAKHSGVIVWNQRNDKGDLPAPGLYFARCSITTSIFEKQLVIER